MLEHVQVMKIYSQETLIILTKVNLTLKWKPISRALFNIYFCKCISY